MLHLPKLNSTKARMSKISSVKPENKVKKINDTLVYSKSPKRRKPIRAPQSKLGITVCQHQIGSMVPLINGAKIIMGANDLESLKLANPPPSFPCGHHLVTLDRESTAAWLQAFHRRTQANTSDGSPPADHEPELYLLALDVARLKSKLTPTGRLSLISKLASIE